MSLFQTSVVKKYLNDLSSELIDEKYKAFIEYFGNPEIQQNIRDSKEEEFQEGFIRELFVKILDYTLKPNVNFNIVLEKKNVDDSKKADGAILKDDNVIAVIELKSTQTTDLDTVETQAFGYKNHHPKCHYIITSNFEKIRLYIQNAIDHLEFDLFNLSKEDFALLWLCFSKDNILNDIPLKIKEASVLQEENVTKQLYNNYSKFRKEIFANIVKNNTEFDKLVLFKKTQKLLDRFLFIFFAEDKLLLPPNSISEIIKQWITLKDDLDEYVPLYDRFKKYFGYLNTGFKGKKYDIFAYNGGLFLPDEILDNIKIDDEILHQNTLQLSTYDFETEVDVNILGHIFEHSLSEIENVQAEIAGEVIDKQKTKRKKDGIFYTPKYITKYIVENTVGKLCEEKRNEFGIIDEEYAKGRRNRKKEIVRNLDNKLIKYREWLLEITILDPACGSGAFLNQALEFLINEHKKIDELKAQLLGGSIIFPDIEAKILEKNIYGVDLNEESVEIAKLSLWLRTAQKGRKLTILSNNIKCGNSLIDDPEVAGEKAFNWYTKFPNVFRKKDKKAWHVTMVLHNSRYALTDGFTRQLEPGFVAQTFPELSTDEQKILTDELANAAKEYDLNILECNICTDHVHAILVCEEEELTTLVGKWKGRTAYTYNRRVNPSVDEQAAMYADGTKEKFWAKRFHHKLISDDDQLENTIKYIRNNREKHELPPTTDGLTRLLREMTCTPEHAYRTEYKGGFDVVIGNPPYVNINVFPKNIHNYFKSIYKSIHTGYNDLMYYFLSKGIDLLNDKGVFGVITSNYFIGNEYAKLLRSYLSNHISEILNFGNYLVFEDANVHTAIIFAEKNQCNETVKYNSLIDTRSSLFGIEPERFETIKKDRKSLQDNWIFTSNKKNKIIERLLSNSKLLGELAEIEKGSTSGKNDVFTVTEEVVKEYKLERELLRKNVKNGDILRYGIHNRNTYLIYTDSNTEIEKYPNIFNYLKEHQNVLAARNEVKKGSYFWWRLERPRRKEVFDTSEKIIVPYRASHNRFAYDNEKRFNDGGDIRVILVTDKNLSVKYTLGILNSKLIDWYYGFIGKPKGNSREYFNEPLARIPVSIANNSTQTNIAQLVDFLTKENEELQNIHHKFIKYLQSQFQLESLSKKLQNWYEIDFGDFIKELNKAIKKVDGEKLTKTDEMEWMDVFESKKSEAQNLKAEIDKIDKEIDQMIYELYGLTEEEIKIVEEIN